MDRVNDRLSILADLVDIVIEVENPAERLLRRRDVVTLGAEHDDRRADVPQVNGCSFGGLNLACGQIVTDEQLVDDELNFFRVEVDVTAPPALKAEVARRLKQAGVRAIDVAGRGGTSWYAVEAQRAAKQGKAAETTFADWGIPTEEALVAVRQAVPDLQIVGSGGIRTGLDIAKCLALGADVGAFGQPLLAAALESPVKVVEFIRGIIYEIKITMLCVGAKNLDALKKTPLVRRST